MCNRISQLRKGRAAKVGIAIALALIFLLTSCDAKRDYKTLSFFFDGVPNPNAPPPPSAGTAVRFTVIRPLEQMPRRAFQHKPFALNQCSQCHTSDGKQLSRLNSVDLCIKCHTNTTHEFPVMHGPVSNGLCLWCHDPHESDQPHLLKSTSSELCLQCHDRQLLPSNIAPHLSESAVCLDCHLGHGGATRTLLRSPRSPLAAFPTTRLTTTAPAAGGAP